MSIAKKSGCILSYDPNLRLPLWPSAEDARKEIMSIWDQADIIKVRCLKIQNSCVKVITHSLLDGCRYTICIYPWFSSSFFLCTNLQISEDEITFLTGGDDPYDDNVVLTKLFHPNLSLLVVTEGSEGCRYYTPVSLSYSFLFYSQCHYLSGKKNSLNMWNNLHRIAFLPRARYLFSWLTNKLTQTNLSEFQGSGCWC